MVIKNDNRNMKSFEPDKELIKKVSAPYIIEDDSSDNDDKYQ